MKQQRFIETGNHSFYGEYLYDLMIAACLAYLWIVYMGCIAVKDAWVKVIHRTDRCDWSLFRLGLALLDHLLNKFLPIPVSFNLLEKNCVR